MQPHDFPVTAPYFLVVSVRLHFPSLVVYPVFFSCCSFQIVYLSHLSNLKFSSMVFLSWKCLLIVPGLVKYCFSVLILYHPIKKVLFITAPLTLL